MSDDRIPELEAELAAAQRTIEVLIARLERVGTATPTSTELFDAAARLGHVLEERTREVEDARAEFRALRANLDQMHDALIDAGLTQAQFDEDRVRMEDPSVYWPSQIMWTACGRKP